MYTYGYIYILYIVMNVGLIYNLDSYYYGLRFDERYRPMECCLYFPNGCDYRQIISHMVVDLYTYFHH